MTLNESLEKFPTHQASVATALSVILLTGVVVLVKLAIGQVFPNGYEPWLFLLGTLAGVNVAGLATKRFTDYGYVEAKARGKAAGTADNGAGPSLNIEGDATISATAERSAVAPQLKPVVPQGNVKPGDPDVREAITAYAERQKAAAAHDDDPGII